MGWRKLMAKQNFSLYTPRDKPKKRPGKHKKSLSKSEKRNNKHKKYIGQGGWQLSLIILYSLLESEEYEKSNNNIWQYKSKTMV